MSEPAGDSREVVLIVDDNDDARELMSRILRDEGLHVVEAPSGARALELLAKVRVDLLVTDVMMAVAGRMSGTPLPEEARPAVEAMARAVGGILADPERRALLVERGRQRARERFGVEGHVAGIIRTYDRILGAASCS